MYQEERGDTAKIWDGIIDLLVGNIGLVFTEGNLTDIHLEILKFKVSAFARAGSIAPLDVSVPAGNTDIDISKQNLFF